MRHAIILLPLLGLTACFSTPKVMHHPLTGGLSLVSAPAQVDPMLSWIGGLCIVAGVAALMVTRTYGLRPILIGIGLVLLNQAVARYGDWLFLPTIIATGAISLAYAFITIRRMLRHRKENGT